MTVFNSLKKMSDPKIQEWLRKIGNGHVESLAIALLGADSSAAQCVFRNMSRIASQTLRKLMEEARLSQPDQKSIELRARELERFLDR